MNSVSRFINKSMLLKYGCKPTRSQIVSLSTTSRFMNSDGNIQPVQETEHGRILKELPKFDAYKKYGHWISYGMDYRDIVIDRTHTHGMFFIMITMCMVGGAYYLYYCPHTGLADWSQREAYIVLREREEAGLAPIQKELVPLDRIVLPTDEELGDTEIII